MNITREKAKELLSIIKAFAEGKTVQIYNSTENVWLDIKAPDFSSNPSSYRIKPEPKYRPFKTQEECWEEMHKHPDFGWIKDNDVYRPIIKIDKEKIYYLEYGFKRTGITHSSFKESLELKFTDGAPFGVKEE